MSEFLTVRLSRNPQTPIRWLVWSTSQNEIIASGELSGKDQLNELARYAHQRTSLLLLDSSDVLLVEAEIPVGAGRQVEHMLPYLLEDDIAQDVEQLHFTVLSKKAQHIQVAAVDIAYLTEWLDAFSEAGIVIKKMLPDAQALPLLDNAISAVKIDSQWLFRKSQYQSSAIEEEWLGYFIESDWCVSEVHRHHIISYTAQPESQKENEQWECGEPELVMELLAKGAITSSTNLLTGPFKPQSSIFKHLKVWRKVVIAVCLFLLVLTVQRVLQVNQYEAQAKAYRDESERIFRSIFPDKNRIPTVSYLKRQMTDEENRLSHGSSGTSVLGWLSQLPDAIKGQPSVQISNIRYDANRGEVRIEISTSDFQIFESIRIKLSEKFAVTQGPLDRKENRVFGSFVLRSRP